MTIYTWGHVKWHHKVFTIYRILRRNLFTWFSIGPWVLGDQSPGYLSSRSGINYISKGRWAWYRVEAIQHRIKVPLKGNRAKVKNGQGRGHSPLMSSKPFWVSPRQLPEGCPLAPPGGQRASQQQTWRWDAWESLTDAEAKTNTLATWCEELTHLKRPWCWEKLMAGGEGDDRGWGGWMASPTQWTWVWVSSRSRWWTGKPGGLPSMGLQRVGCDWTKAYQGRC